MMRRSSRGFTLLEVLVALAIVALGMAALMAALTSAADATGHLRDKSFAEWVALNRLAEVRLALVQAEEGKVQGTTEFGGMKFGLANALKDVRYYNQMAMEFGIAGSMASATLQTLTQAVNLGFGGPEHMVASLVPAVAKMNNTNFPPR